MKIFINNIYIADTILKQKGKNAQQIRKPHGETWRVYT